MRPRSILAGLALLAATLAPAIANAATTAYTTGNVNMRAGPSTQYPRIATVPQGSRVTVYGCTQGYGWCDSAWAGRRGWISGRYLSFAYQGRRVLVPDYGPRIGLPIIGFSLGTYWGRYYRDYDWYDRWPRDRGWRDGRPVRPPVRVQRPRDERPVAPRRVVPGQVQPPARGVQRPPAGSNENWYRFRQLRDQRS
ncbi:SH3 domain-containing protein [Faunimonas sp. B44]|uniref:SH3 domain-containing protein n=1 Tax=Faunimonas sp. B44 TaxID=3461493 RepID=UPI004044E407